MIISASAGISYFVGSNTPVFEDPANADSCDSKKLYIYGWQDSESDDRKVVVYSISFDRTKKELFYSSYLYTGNNEDVVSQENLLADYVTDFSVTLYDESKGKNNTVSENEVRYKITFGVGDKKYETQNTVTLRNDIYVNRGLSEVAVTPVPYKSTVTGVAVLPGPSQIIQGGSYTYKAKVSGINQPSQDVTWSIEGENDQNTVINSANGTLDIGADETSQEIRIIATSVQDNSVKNADTSVVSASYMNDVSLIKESDNGTGTVKATLKVTGKSLLSNVLTPQIKSEAFTITDGTSAVSDCTVTADNTPENNLTDISFDITFDCSKASDGSTRVFSIPITYAGKSRTVSISVSVAIKSTYSPITSVVIKRTDGAVNGSQTMWRGESGSYEAFVVRGTGSLIPVTEDTECTCVWKAEDMSGYGVSSISVTDKGNSTVGISESSEVFPYNESTYVHVEVEVTDLANRNKTTTGFYQVTVPEVKMTLSAKKRYLTSVPYYYTYSGYNYSIKYGNILIHMDYTGLMLANGEDITNRLSMQDFGSYTATAVSSGYDLKFTADSDASVSFALGDKMDTWYETEEIGSTAGFAYSLARSNVYKATWGGGYTSLLQYVPVTSTSSSGYLCDGTPYTITVQANRKNKYYYLGLNGTTYTWYGSYWY